MSEQQRNFRILPRVAEKLARLSHGRVIRNALARTTDSNVSEDARRAERRKHTLLALDGWRKKFRGRLSESGWGAGQYTEHQQQERILAWYPHAIISKNDNKGYLAIRREQPAEQKSNSSEKALHWKQQQQWKILTDWYDYLISPNAAQQYKSIPGFREMVIDTVSRYVPKLEEVTNEHGDIENVVVQEERKADTRDAAPDFNPADLAIAFDLLKAILTESYEKTYSRGDMERTQINYGKNWDGNFYALYAEARLRRAAATEAYKKDVKPNTWRQFGAGEGSFLAAISANTDWCLAGESVAESYLETKGEEKQALWVFFDNNRNPVMALHGRESVDGRFAIKQLRYKDDTAFVTDPALLQRLDEFVTEENFTNATTYREEINDQRTLFNIEELLDIGAFDSLPEEDQKKMLEFLYEVNQPIKFRTYANHTTPRILVR